MKIGIFSDIHSNVIAFRNVIEYMENAGCEEYLLLGDYVSDTPYTAETMALLHEFIKTHSCHVLRGNREEYMLHQRCVRAEKDELSTWINNSAAGNLLFTYEQLSEEDLDFFESLPISFVYEKEGYPSITCCHGSPSNTRELLQLSEEPVKDWLEKIDTDYMICAHTHFPGELKYHSKHYFNSGCFGIPITDHGFSQILIIESVEEQGKTVWKPDFIKVPFDKYKVVNDIRSSGLLDRAPWFINSNIQILLTGEDNSARLVKLAAKLQQEDGKENNWPLTEEKYFEQAAAIIGIPDYRNDKNFILQG